MKNYKSLSLLLVVALMLALFAACSGEAAVRDDVAVSDLSNTVCTTLENSDDMTTVDELYITGIMKMDVSNVSEYDIRVNSRGTTIDEYGMFKASDESQVAAIEETVKSYLQMRKDTWMPEYMPEEYPKLENATIAIMGNYVFYMILSDDAKQNAQDVFASSLAE